MPDLRAQVLANHHEVVKGAQAGLMELAKRLQQTFKRLEPCMRCSTTRRKPVKVTSVRRKEGRPCTTARPLQLSPRGRRPKVFFSRFALSKLILRHLPITFLALADRGGWNDLHDSDPSSKRRLEDALPSSDDDDDARDEASDEQEHASREFCLPCCLFEKKLASVPTPPLKTLSAN
jgi:hypothetical protein